MVDQCPSGASRKIGSGIAGLLGGSATFRKTGHFVTTSARALQIGVAKRRHMTAGNANEPILRLPKHGPELAAQHTIGAAHNFVGHFFLVLLPSRPKYNFGLSQSETSRS
jgi:hypothetical protein